MTAGSTAVERMGQWVADLRFAQIPENVRRIALHAIIDTLGVALAGSVMPVARRARDAMIGSDANGQCDLIGLEPKTTAMAAAFANGVAAHALDFDDNSYAGFVHASAVVVPAALAAAQLERRSGADLLTAYVAGVECEFVLAEALGRAPYDAGWWTTGLLGSIGACAAACSALRLDAKSTISALGLVMAGSGGTKSVFGTDAKSLVVGQTAEAGVRAALLARAGCSGPVDALDGEAGLAALVNNGSFKAAKIDRLGRHWNLLEPGVDIKRIPVCLSSHAAVDALRELLSEGLDSALIESIVCDVPPIVMRNLAYAQPVTPQQAQFSMPFSIASTLVLGDVNLDCLDPDVLARPDMIRAMLATSMISTDRWLDPVMQRQAPEGALVNVLLRDGRSVERFRAMPDGSAQQPMSKEEISAKFLACARRAIPDRAAQRALTALNALHDQADVQNLFA